MATGWLIFCFLALHDVTTAKDLRDASRLMKFLIRSSNASVLPVKNNDTSRRALLLRIGVTLSQIINVKWQNELLSWNPAEYGNMESINIEKDKLWIPDIYIYNHVEGGVKSALDQWKTPITINSSGYCTWMAPGVVKTSCKLNVRYFPFDEQKCKIKYGSWTYHGYQLDLEPDHKGNQADTKGFIKSGEWDLTKFVVQRNEGKYACCPEPYPDVTFTLIIQRRTRYYYINMLLPNMFITVLTLVAFFLPPDCGERISLIITNFLAMVVFLLLVAEILPPNSEVTPMISIYCAGLMCEVGLALVASCVVLRLYCRHSGFDKMPSWVKYIVLRWLAKLTFTSSLVQKVNQDTQEKARKFLELVKPDSISRSRKRIAAKFGEDKAIESVCLLSPEWDSTYDLNVPDSADGEEQVSAGEPWSTHKRKDDSFEKELTVTEAESQPCTVKGAANMQTIVQDTKGCICKALVDKLESRQKVLVEHVGNMTSMLTDQEISTEKQREWQLASSILDRSFLVFFVVGLIVSSVAIFMQIPRA